jgi:hypothetical protein
VVVEVDPLVDLTVEVELKLMDLQVVLVVVLEQTILAVHQLVVTELWVKETLVVMDLQQETVTVVAVAVLAPQDSQMFLERLEFQAVVLAWSTMALHILQAVALAL